MVYCHQYQEMKHRKGVVMADLTPLRIAALVHARKQANGEPLPQPIGLSINRHHHLTLAFNNREDMEMWRAELVSEHPTPSYGPVYSENHTGELVVSEQTPVGPIRYTVRTTVVSI